MSHHKPYNQSINNHPAFGWYPQFIHHEKVVQEITDND